MPELDDVAEKARRNLMVVSSGILAVAILGIPLDGKLVGAVDLSSVQPWRAWLVASVVLLYFGARYYYAPKIAEAWAPWATRRAKYLKNDFARMLTRAIRGEGFREGVNGIKIEWKDVPTNDAVFPSLEIASDTVRRRGEFTYRWDVPDSLRSFVAETLKQPDPGHFPTEILTARYRFTWRYYLKTQWQAFRFAYKPSWDLLEMSVPWILALAAAIVCVCKFMASVYYAWPFVRQLLSA